MKLKTVNKRIKRLENKIQKLKQKRDELKIARNIAQNELDIIELRKYKEKFKKELEEGLKRK
jgi:response regulator of citrate/malate metabolism